MKRDWLLTAFVILLAGAIAAWLFTGSGTPEERGHERDHGHAGHGDRPQGMATGPHGGRLLVDQDFALEVTIFEAGVPPEFRVYAYQDSRPLPPDKIALELEVERLGGVIQRFGFSPQGDYLRGQGKVYEPHSFDVTVRAEFAGQKHRWSYPSHEGRTEISAAVAEDAGIVTEHAGPAHIHETLDLTGRVQVDPDRLARVRPRFPGVVQSVDRELGDSVEAGDILATVQSNESLQGYPVRAPIGGTIIGRDLQVGETTGDTPLFLIADTSHVWIELDLFSRDLGRVHTGQQVTVETLDGHYRARGLIDWISPLAAHASQSVTARVPMDNVEGRLRPGQFVRGTVEVADYAAALAVRRSALQRFRDHQVVYARFGELYEVRMVELGRGDRDWVEVLDGLAPGTEYVTQNSYLVKADIEKSGATHDH
jgi:cobalt-zinc-cadmium efflux system membrane fusion protein